MNTRIAIYELAARHKLDVDAINKLRELAAFGRQPTALASRMSSATALAGTLLLGLGIISWVAANWHLISRTAHFTLLQVSVVLPLLLSVFLPSLRTAFAMLSALAVGALLACLGQTYQTGADTWQLFALWALLTLPFAVFARADALWALFLLVALTGLGFWLPRDSFGQITVPDYPERFATAWLLLALFCAAVSPQWAPQTGTGMLSRFVCTMALLVLSIGDCLTSLRSDYSLGGERIVSMLILVCIGWMASRLSARDITTLCMCGLCLDVMCMFELWHAMDASRIHFDTKLLLGAAAASLLSAATTAVVLLRIKKMEVRDE